MCLGVFARFAISPSFNEGQEAQVEQEGVEQVWATHHVFLQSSAQAISQHGAIPKKVGAYQLL